MIFGFNTDVHVNDLTYHIQTEDRGAKNPVVDSMIYVGGKIVDRVRTPYDPAATQPEIESMVRNQHRELVEAIRAGSFAPSTQPLSEPLPPPAPYGVRLMNPDEIVSGDQFRFELCVWNRIEAAPAQGVSLDVRWMNGSEETQRLSLQAGEEGEAVACFPLADPTQEMGLLVCASGAEGRSFARFRVRSSSVASDE